jgi:hypothetical protein
MPHLMNCPHHPDGWCLACVKELWEEKARLERALKSVNEDLDRHERAEADRMFYDDRPDRFNQPPKPFSDMGLW